VCEAKITERNGKIMRRIERTPGSCKLQPTGQFNSQEKELQPDKTPEPGA